MLTPSAHTRRCCRYHGEQKTPIRGEVSPRQFLGASEVQQESKIRHTKDPGAAVKPQSPRGETRGDVAGVPSNRRSRYDTPAGMSNTLGHSRAGTPDYHRKYEANALGTSLPGSGGNAAGIVATPRGRRAVETRQHAPSNQNMASCWFHLNQEESAGNRPRTKFSLGSGGGRMTPRAT